MSYYEILQVDSKASKEVIEMAYKALVKKYHPDVNPPDKRGLCEEIMIRLNEARDVLTNDFLRAQYDEKLNQGKNSYENTFEYEDNKSHDETYSNVNNNSKKPNDEYNLIPGAWSRYFARFFDMYLEVIVLLFILSYFFPSIYNSMYKNLGNYLSGIVIYIICLCLESYFISQTGATLGKWFFNIKIVSYDGKRLTFKNALIRSFDMFARGLFLGIPILTVVSMWISYCKVKNSEVLSWDILTNCKVIHKKNNPIKICIFLTIWLLLFVIITIGNNKK
jgi:curved DNA-binding protein CbpA